MLCGSPRASDGLPCERQCSIGYTSCWFHGGKAPAAKHTAERALALVRMPAIEALHTIIHNWQTHTCPICKEPDSRPESLQPVIRAAQIILDRTGFGPRAVLEVAKPESSDIDLTALTDDERKQLGSLLGQLRTLKAAIRGRLAGFVEQDQLPVVLALAAENAGVQALPFEAKDSLHNT